MNNKLTWRFYFDTLCNKLCSISNYNIEHLVTKVGC